MYFQALAVNALFLAIQVAAAPAGTPANLEQREDDHNVFNNPRMIRIGYVTITSKDVADKINKDNKFPKHLVTGDGSLGPTELYLNDKPGAPLPAGTAAKPEEVYYCPAGADREHFQKAAKVWLPADVQASRNKGKINDFIDDVSDSWPSHTVRLGAVKGAEPKRDQMAVPYRILNKLEVRGFCLPADKAKTAESNGVDYRAGDFQIKAVGSPDAQTAEEGKKAAKDAKKGGDQAEKAGDAKPDASATKEPAAKESTAA